MDRSILPVPPVHRSGGSMNRKECLIQALREALIQAYSESNHVCAIVAELAEMGFLPQIAVQVFEQKPEYVPPFDATAYDEEFLRAMRIAVD